MGGGECVLGMNPKRQREKDERKAYRKALAACEDRQEPAVEKRNLQVINRALDAPPRGGEGTWAGWRVAGCFQSNLTPPYPPGARRRLGAKRQNRDQPKLRGDAGRDERGFSGPRLSE